jgi:hypothetical protein
MEVGFVEGEAILDSGFDKARHMLSTEIHFQFLKARNQVGFMNEESDIPFPWMKKNSIMVNLSLQTQAQVENYSLDVEHFWLFLEYWSGVPCTKRWDLPNQSRSHSPIPSQLSKQSAGQHKPHHPVGQ